LTPLEELPQQQPDEDRQCDSPEQTVQNNRPKIHEYWVGSRPGEDVITWLYQDSHERSRNSLQERSRRMISPKQNEEACAD
jgi:hypothetical protein